jgi:hypothetical protein
LVDPLGRRARWDRPTDAQRVIARSLRRVLPAQLVATMIWVQLFSGAIAVQTR